MESNVDRLEVRTRGKEGGRMEKKRERGGGGRVEDEREKKITCDQGLTRLMHLV